MEKTWNLDPDIQKFLDSHQEQISKICNIGYQYSYADLNDSYSEAIKAKQEIDTPGMIAVSLNPGESING